MARTYFPIMFRFNNLEGYMLWYNDDIDGIVTDPNGKAVVFRDLDAAQVYVRERGWDLDDGKPVLYDIARIRQWAVKPTHIVDAVEILNTWNFFKDVRASMQGVHFMGDDDENLDLYEKLFAANNILWARPNGERYVPVWSADEIQEIADVLQNGIALLGAFIPPQEEWQ